MAKISKNQRAVSVKQVKLVCLMGHPVYHILVIGQGMKLRCACDGYEPIDTAAPYKQRMARQRPSSTGKPWFEIVPSYDKVVD